MRNLILFDDDRWISFLPLSYTRPLSELRIGILTIRKKWEIMLDAKSSYITQNHLSEKFPIQIESDNILINSRLLPNEKILKLVNQLDNNEALLCSNDLLAARMDENQFERLLNNLPLEELRGMDLSCDDSALETIQYPEDIFLNNETELLKDFSLLTGERKSESIPASNFVTSPAQIFIEKNVTIEHTFLNASTGPIFISRGANIMDGSMIRGPVYIGKNSVLKMGSKIYGPSTIGPGCVVGGEIKHSVLFGNSNKSHDGYLGNSIIGEWCNLGANTNASNLKNDFAFVKFWDYATEKFRKTATQYGGVIMGDYSRCSINTMFNTGTVVGVCTNVYGAGFPRNFIPSYSLGGKKRWQTNSLEKAMRIASLAMERRNKQLSELDKNILNYIFYESAKYRTWEI